MVALVLPSFRGAEEERLAAGGLVVLLAGAAPFLHTGLAHGTSGLFDRGNLYADVGTSMVFAGVCGLLWRPARARPALICAAIVLLGVLAFQNVQDLEDYQRAGDDGHRLLHAADELPAGQRRDVVIAPLPDRHGVSMFVEDYDLRAAMALRYHTPPARLGTRMALTFPEARRAGALVLRRGRLVPLH